MQSLQIKHYIQQAVIWKKTKQNKTNVLVNTASKLKHIFFMESEWDT